MAADQQLDFDLEVLAWATHLQSYMNAGQGYISTAKAAAGGLRRQGAVYHCPTFLSALQGYAANYTAFGKVNRLLHIARQTQGSPLELESLRLAADQLKQAGAQVFPLMDGHWPAKHLLGSLALCLLGWLAFLKTSCAYAPHTLTSREQTQHSTPKSSTGSMAGWGQDMS